MTEMGGATSLVVSSVENETFDLDDMFGIRRALHMLPEHLWDDFFSAWAEIANACALDLERMQAVAARRAIVAGGRDAVDGELSNAWGTVSAAMSSYLAWRTLRAGSLSQSGDTREPRGWLVWERE